jgi:hypothetical protein
LTTSQLTGFSGVQDQVLQHISILQAIWNAG